MKKQIKREVSRVDRSPMNPKRWCVELSCGHELWVTGKPRKKVFPCEQCECEDTNNDN